MRIPGVHSKSDRSDARIQPGLRRIDACRGDTDKRYARIEKRIADGGVAATDVPPAKPLGRKSQTGEMFKPLGEL